MLYDKLHGLTLPTITGDYNVFLTDINGGDIVNEFKDEVVFLRENKDQWNKPVVVYIATGMLGRIHVEQLVLYVYKGVPYILSTQESLSGTVDSDGDFDTNGETFIYRLHSNKMAEVYSIGSVPPHTNVMKYAKQYMATTPLMKDPQIRYELVEETVLSMDIRPNGIVSEPGGRMFSVYELNGTISSIIRPNKDFTKDPVNKKDLTLILGKLY